jgi:hypothetical protein
LTHQAKELSNLEMGELSLLPRESRYQQKLVRQSVTLKQVVPTDIPLLLSKASLKKAEAVLDMKK